MVDVSTKAPTTRVAVARAAVCMPAAVRAAVLDGSLRKGEALAVARLAAIQAAKETPRLIPLCHPLPLTGVSVDLEPVGEDRIEIRVRVTCTGPTGVEMEAMTGAAVGALALYDMCKSLDRGIAVRDVELLHKSGGKSGVWDRSPVAAS